MEKHSESRLSYLFAHLHLLSSDLFSSDSSHLCFSTVHIVGSFTSKLPSISIIYIYVCIHRLYIDDIYRDDRDCIVTRCDQLPFCAVPRFALGVSIFAMAVQVPAICAISRRLHAIACHCINKAYFLGLNFRGYPRITWPEIWYVYVPPSQ